jgi:NADP-dependent 3-hydroxy acid dehydrogenase YdfG
MMTYSVSDARAVEQAIAMVVENFGRIDVFIANAGKFKDKCLSSKTFSDIY